MCRANHPVVNIARPSPCQTQPFSRALRNLGPSSELTVPGRGLTICMTSKHGVWPACKYSRHHSSSCGLTQCRHLILTESMLSVYKQAEHIAPQDQTAFAFYAMVTMSGVHHHHLQEETQYCKRYPTRSAIH
jgi:hypothetical protein